ncbi:MAG: DNA lyase [Magnetococcales bacterium]|nr:DNA lyase [Magnetococcales bacterium]
MRLWTLHPRYLDRQGLATLWRESLLAQAVLRGETWGYRRHPQVLRIQGQPDPHGAIASYLEGVLAEAQSRGYRFDSSRIACPAAIGKVDETMGQLMFEWEHLRRKLAVRSPEILAKWENVSVPDSHPLFRIVEGGVSPWERGTNE